MVVLLGHISEVESSLLRLMSVSETKGRKGCPGSFELRFLPSVFLLGFGVGVGVSGEGALIPLFPIRADSRAVGTGQEGLLQCVCGGAPLG